MIGVVWPRNGRMSRPHVAAKKALKSVVFELARLPQSIAYSWDGGARYYNTRDIEQPLSL
jgi:hypothetical protein